MPGETLEIAGFEIQSRPLIYHGLISGRWLLAHSTPSWRMKDPILGFQRLVREDRVRSIAIAVLDQKRSFPNSIILATNLRAFAHEDCRLFIPLATKFFVVDGQHRLWAQNFSDYEAKYSCVIHMGLTEVKMAELFLEINDNQKRVPSSLRWDLVRLTRPEGDLPAQMAADIVFTLATDNSSPLFQRIDLTGEQAEIKLKQGSIAPEIKQLATSKKSGISGLSFDTQYNLVLQFFIALKDLNSDKWVSGESAFYKARVLRAALRLIPEMLARINKVPSLVTYSDFRTFLERIDVATLETDQIIAMQGDAGIKAIYQQLCQQAFI